MVRNKTILLPPASVLQLQEKWTFCSVLNLVLKGKYSVSVAGFWEELCVRVVGYVGDIAVWCYNCMNGIVTGQ